MKKYLLLFLGNLAKNKFVILFGVLVMMPWMYSYICNFGSLFFETQNELNIGFYLTDVFNLDPLYRYGQFSYGEYRWLFYLLPIQLLQLIFGISAGYIYVGLLFLVGYIFSYLFIRNYVLTVDNRNTYSTFAIALISFVLVTSPTFFLYLKSTISLTMPALLFPMQLYMMFRFFDTKRIVYLSCFILGFFLYSFANITTILFNVIFLVIFIIIFAEGFPWKRIIFLGFVTFPFLVFQVLLTYTTLQFNFSTEISSSITEFIREDFYSGNTSILNIFRQVADWGFFGSFKGILYYDFSPYYKYPIISVLGVIFFGGLLALIVLNKDISRKKYLLVLSILGVIFLMLGLKNPIYKYFYDNFSPFHIFRNIQKLAPFLLFLLCFGMFFFVKNKKAILFVIFLGMAGVLYNLPYYTYHNFFTKLRTLPEIIPSNLQDGLEYLKNNLDERNDKILYIPSVPINETFKFSTHILSPGILGDRFLNIQGVRLSNKLNGDVRIQDFLSKAYLKDNQVERGVSFDFEKFEEFNKKFGFNYFVYYKDVYQAFEPIEKFFEIFESNPDYEKIFDNDAMIIYRYKYKSRERFFIEGAKYESNIGKMGGNFSIIPQDDKVIIYLRESFNPSWKISGLPADIKVQHYPSDDGDNVWMFDAQDIKEKNISLTLNNSIQSVFVMVILFLGLYLMVFILFITRIGFFLYD